MGNCTSQSLGGRRAGPAGPRGAENDLPADASIVFVLGGPGSGKGTQCAKVVAKYGFTHLSAGDLLRAEVASGSATGQQCEAIMREGKLVPMEVTIALLRAAMVSSGAKEFLIDGFPRALDQAARFEEMVKPCEAVIFLDCPEEVMEARLLKRGETSGRSDDNAETIRKRFHTFVGQSLPVVDHYEAQGKAHRISATAPPDEVFVRVEAVIDQIHGKAAAEAAAAKPEAAEAKPAANGGGAAAEKQKQEQKQPAPEAVPVNATPGLAFA